MNGDDDSPRICGWSCPHLTIISFPGWMDPQAVPGCGCEMQPVYENTA